MLEAQPLTTQKAGSCLALQRMLIPDQIRVTIALTALSHKPAEQTFESYIEVLLEKFPSATVHRDSGERQTQLQGRIFLLEKKLNDLQHSFDNEHAELLLLRAAATSRATESPGVSASSTTESATGSKKKKKKGNTQDLQQARRSGPSQVFKLPSLCGSDNLLSRLYLLDRIISREEAIPEEQFDSLWSVTERALAMLATTLTSMLSTDKDLRSHKAGLMGDLTALVDRILTIVPKLYSAAGSSKNGQRRKEARTRALDRLDALFGQLSATLLVPLVHSFIVISRAQVASALKSSPSSRKERKDYASQNREVTGDGLANHLLSFFQTTLDSLQSIATSLSRQSSASLILSVQGVFDNLLTAVCWELENLYSTTPDPTLSSFADGTGSFNKYFASSSRSPLFDIEGRLARKDALWYLCSLMRLLIPASTVLSSLLPSQGVLPAPQPTNVWNQNSANNTMEIRDVDSRASTLKWKNSCQETYHATMTQMLCASLARLLRLGRTDSSGEDEKRMHVTYGGLQEMERSMLLAVAEEIWLTFR